MTNFEPSLKYQICLSKNNRSCVYPEEGKNKRYSTDRSREGLSWERFRGPDRSPLLAGGALVEALLRYFADT